MKKLLLGLSFLFVVYLICNFLNHDFSQESIRLDAWPEVQAKFHTPDEIQQIQKIVDQPFTFLGKGRTIIAFISQDGKYVLKLIRTNRFKDSWLFDNFPLPRFLDRLRHASIKARKSRANGLFTSLNLCENELALQTGTLFCHIVPTPELCKSVTVTDRLGFAHEIDLDSVPFTLQKKAVTVIPVLQSLLKEKKYRALNERLDQLIELALQRAKCGIVVADTRLLYHDNIGYLEDCAIYIDNGTFLRSYQSLDRYHLEADFRQYEPIVKLLKAHNAKLADDFKRRMQLAVTEKDSES